MEYAAEARQELRIRKNVTYLVLDNVSRNASHRREELEMFPGRQQIEENVVLRAHPRHAANHMHVVRISHVITEYQGRASRWRRQSRQYVEQSRFARTVVPQDRCDLALVDGKIDAVDCLDLGSPALAVRLVEVDDANGLAALHLAHDRLDVAIRVFPRDEAVGLAVDGGTWRWGLVAIIGRCDT